MSTSFFKMIEGGRVRVREDVTMEAVSDAMLERYNLPLLL